MHRLATDKVETIQNIIYDFKKYTKCENCAYDKWKDCPCYLIFRLRQEHEEVEEWIK